MDVINTHCLTLTVRKKLIYEASRVNHDLRLVVGHANLLKMLLNLADTAHEREYRHIKAASSALTPSQDEVFRHTQWVSVTFEELEDWIPGEK
jgi:hypothetical protein